MPKSLAQYKRLFSVILVITLLFAAGCSNNTHIAGAGPESAKPANDGKVLPARKKLVLWHIQMSGNILGVIKHSVDRFMADNPNVDVEVVPYSNEAYKVKLVVAMGTRNLPDIFPTWAGGPLHEYINAGQVLDITRMMQTNNYKDYFLDSAIKMVTYEDRIWGVPVEGSHAAVIFYNKKIFQQYGISVPKTYSSLIEVIKMLRSKGITPFALANRTKWPGSIFYMYFVDRLGGPKVFENAAARTGASFDDPVFVKAGEMVQQLVKLGAFPDGFNGLDYDTAQSRTLMYSGKAAMELMGSWEISTIEDENREFYKNNLDFFPFPELEGGKGDSKDIVGTMGDNFYSVSNSCKYPEEAFKLIQYLIDDKAVNERILHGRIPPVKNPRIDDPMLKRIQGIISGAPSVQFWYDQYLPPELGEKHKDTCQAIFDLSLTPDEAVRQMENAAKGYYSSRN